MTRRKESRGFTLIEVLLAVIITAVVFGCTLYWFRMANQSIVKVSDHAQARMNAMKILDYITEDLRRCVIDDNIDRLIRPVELLKNGTIDEVSGNGLRFHGLHHRHYDAASKQMSLVAQEIEYGLEAIPGQRDAYHVMRNGKRLRSRGSIGAALDPVSNLSFETLDPQRACQYRISPHHAITVKVFPRGAWDQQGWGKQMGTGGSIAERNVQERLVRLSHIESRFACMLSIKNSGAPPALLAAAYPTIYKLNAGAILGVSCPDFEQVVNVPMDWIQPPGLIKLEDAPFDDASANKDQ